ncbi:glycosyltransferase family 9 protein, partial [bacterium]|nr:glycosyltransferase family 9 protein [candidate division CSSED10-310 bacterium]
MGKTFVHGKPAGILMVKTHAMGDVLMTTPAIRAVRRHFPQASIHYLTGVWSAPILERNPDIDRVIAVDDAVFHDHRWIDRVRLIGRLRKERYDVCVLFQPAPAMHLFARLTGAAQIAAPVAGAGSRWVHMPSPWRRERNRYVGEDFLDVVRNMGIDVQDTQLVFSVDSGVLAEMACRLRDRGLESGQFLVICPGGGRNPRDWVEQKIWPADRY